MMLTQTKKDFLKKISGGLHVLMATSYTADDIAVNPECDIEEYIAEHLLDHENSAIGEERAWFSEKKFGNFIDTESEATLHKAEPQLVARLGRSYRESDEFWAKEFDASSKHAKLTA